MEHETLNEQRKGNDLLAVVMRWLFPKKNTKLLI